ncbi:TetR/AcrR family transcriptional regulator [Mucilaginibacter limnophilus]|uniref:Biofilm operon icaADBC HTH-type negative transcriptional regulator IcaR n=1 Tax=Mucilaginibacter limnophilus TaxID=1932778 RepID=A0A3S2Y2X8_9SPHI|nr:TetR family transcriptional regulator [Mucilaginibacter limnophilus]RVU00685.1 TetR/AcrR family transcriptional regulator [Mucilaginibacter limnophilus]
MGRKSLKEDQQKKIIEAFYEVAKREGIENTSFGKVAKELDMHPSLVVHYFATKEEMLLGLIDHIIVSYQNIYQAEEGHSDPLDTLVDVMHNIFSRKWNNYIDDSIFYNCFALIFRNQAIKQQFRELHVLLRKWLENLIQSCVDRGLLDHPDPAMAADLIFVISDGAYYFMSMIDDPGKYDLHMARYKQEAFKLLRLERFL